MNDRRGVALGGVLGAGFAAAVYDSAIHFYLNPYRSLTTPDRDENFKGRLQQVAQERFGSTPFYDSEGARVGNQREYASVVFAGAEPLGTGHGATKKEAEQEAARAALQGLGDGLVANAAPKAARTPRPRKRRTPSARTAASPEEGPAPAEETLTIVPDPEPQPEPIPSPLRGEGQGEGRESIPSPPRGEGQGEWREAPEPSTRSRQIGEPAG